MTDVPEDPGTPGTPQTPDDREFREAYELGRLLGSGGTAEVYEAVQRTLDRRVAVKLLTPRVLQDPDWRERFTREAQICAGLSHPNVLVVLDHGISAGRPYLVTEFVDGQPLAALMADRAQLNAGRIFRIVEQVLDGLEAVHALGVVHRDLKPENILVGSDEDLTVKISDFGVAKKVGARGPVTAAGMVLGTPAYMSPEQVAGQAPGPGSDLYAVAVMFYEMVVGAHPFPHETTTREMLRAQLLVEPSVPWYLHPGLREVLSRGLEKSPRARYQSAAEFRRALRGVEAQILGEAGVVPKFSGPVPVPTRPSPGAGVTRASGPLCVTTSSGEMRQEAVVSRMRPLVVALGVVLALALAAVLTALVLR